MKKGWMALAAVLLAVALPLGGALASIAGLDETLSAYLDTCATASALRWGRSCPTARNR